MCVWGGKVGSRQCGEFMIADSTTYTCQCPLGLQGTNCKTRGKLISQKGVCVCVCGGMCVWGERGAGTPDCTFSDIIHGNVPMDFKAMRN